MRNKHMLRPFFNSFKKDPPSRPPQDPVCGMWPREGIVIVHDGVTYTFCSEHCVEKFRRDPKRYMKK